MNLSSSVRVDQAGVICKQEGIFRVNCMDCLDRTNVVQAAIARAVMEQQVRSVFFCLDLGKETNINYTEPLLFCMCSFSLLFPVPLTF